MSFAADRFANASGALLLGGRSTRMGTDKAALSFRGRPLATRLACTLSEIFDEVLLVGGAAPPGTPGRAVADPPGPPCALRGLLGALQAATSERVLVVATDLPLATPDLLLALLAWPEAEAVVPRTHDGVHPLCALYRRERAEAVARAHLAAGRLALHGLLEVLEVSYLEGADLAGVDPDGRALTNVNRPEDLIGAEQLLA